MFGVWVGAMWYLFHTFGLPGIGLGLCLSSMGLLYGWIQEDR